MRNSRLRDSPMRWPVFYDKVSYSMFDEEVDLQKKFFKDDEEDAEKKEKNTVVSKIKRFLGN